MDKLLGEGPDEQHLDVNLNEDIGGENNTNEERFMEQKASSRSTYFEKLGKVSRLMAKMTVLEKVDVTAKILISHDLNADKLTLRISPKDAKAHLALGLTVQVQQIPVEGVSPTHPGHM